MSKTAIILGSNSDIAKGVMPLLEADGWTVHTWHRPDVMSYTEDTRFDLIVCAVGRVGPPICLWPELDDEYKFEQFKEALESNLVLPIELVTSLWPFHNPGASVCFLAGSNPNMIMPGYFAYNVSKMALLKAVEQMDFETPDAKFFALGPGTILTKIHKATLDTRWDNPKLLKAFHEQCYQEDIDNKIKRVYDCLKWCIDQPKEVIGGRNICVSDYWNNELRKELAFNQDLFKLRRVE